MLLLNILLLSFSVNIWAAEVTVLPALTNHFSGNCAPLAGYAFANFEKTIPENKKNSFPDFKTWHVCRNLTLDTPFPFPLPVGMLDLSYKKVDKISCERGDVDVWEGQNIYAWDGDPITVMIEMPNFKGSLGKFFTENNEDRIFFIDSNQRIIIFSPPIFRYPTQKNRSAEDFLKYCYLQNLIPEPAFIILGKYFLAHFLGSLPLEEAPPLPLKFLITMPALEHRLLGGLDRLSVVNNAKSFMAYLQTLQQLKIIQDTTENLKILMDFLNIFYNSINNEKGTFFQNFLLNKQDKMSFLLNFDHLLQQNIYKRIIEFPMARSQVRNNFMVFQNRMIDIKLSVYFASVPEIFGKSRHQLRNSIQRNLENIALAIPGSRGKINYNRLPKKVYEELFGSDPAPTMQIVKNVNNVGNVGKNPLRLAPKKSYISADSIK